MQWAYLWLHHNDHNPSIYLNTSQQPHLLKLKSDGMYPNTAVILIEQSQVI